MIHRRALVIALAVTPGLVAGAAPQQTSGGGEEKARNVLALVGEATGAAGMDLGSVAFEVETRRLFGEREMEGRFTMRALFPDKLQRVDELSRPDGSPAGTVTRTVDGDEVWTDREGGRGPFLGVGPGFGGGAGGPGGPGQRARLPGAGGEGRADMASIVRRDFYRTLLGLLPTAPALADLTFTHVAEAHADNGQIAEVIDVSGDRFAARLFVDQETHLPLMMTYEAPNRRMMGASGGPPAGDGREERRRRMDAAGPPPLVEHQLFFRDYEVQDGLRVPRTIVRQVDGEVQEQWRITKVEVNPSLDLEDFRKKGGAR